MSTRLISLFIVLALTAAGSPADATQAAPSYYFIDGHRLRTIGPTLEAFRIAYDQYSRGSSFPPWRLLAGRVVDVARRNDGSYTVDFFAGPRNIITVPASATAAAQVTLSNPYYKMYDTEPSITLLGSDAAALLVAAQVWDRESNRIPLDSFFDLKSRDIANYGVFLGMTYLHGKMYYTVVLSPLYFPCLPRCTVAASDWQIRIDAQTFEPGHFQSVGYARRFPHTPNMQNDELFMKLRPVSFLCFALAISVASPAFAVAQTATYHVYRVVDVGKPGVPRLSAAQLEWLNRIKGTPYFKSRLETLWFTSKRATYRTGPPLIVFDAHTAKRSVVEGKSKGWQERWYWVIGNACSAYFEPGVGEFATPFSYPACESGEARLL